ncbi:hypothetical protein [Amycolatopsis echigonensis]|uniref:hypothetical protein n=1 Tax=Amycolatopsis echigonensis TaxID=2576905 RepID=UPI001FC97FF6|nr:MULTISPECIES: hypothetical protein [Amycolatopsis]
MRPSLPAGIAFRGRRNVFDANGKSLENVYVYNDRGRPLTITRYGCDKDTGTSQMIGQDNQFPRPKVVEGVQDDRGNVNGYRGYCREDAGCRSRR